MHGLAVEFKRAAVGLQSAGDDIVERGFSRAVLAEQRVNRAFGDIQIRAVERAGRAEKLFDCAASQIHKKPVTHKALTG